MKLFLGLGVSFALFCFASALFFNRGPSNNRGRPSRRNPKVERMPRCSCGVRNSNTSTTATNTRIVGGEEVGINEFPWRVAMGYNSNFICTASVIDHWWIITAAHCVEKVSASGVVLSFGDHDLRKSNETGHQLRRVSKIIVHEKYDKTEASMENDIAVLRFDRYLEYSREVSPICLPFKQRRKNDRFESGQVIVQGWGDTEEGKGDAGQKLRKVTLDLVDRHECDGKYPQNITSNMICTLTPGKDTCQGDSGGSLDQLDPETNTFSVVGLTSFGEGCARENKPGVSTKVTNYLDWIQKNTGVRYCSQ